MNIIPIFPLLISHSKINVDWDRDGVLKQLEVYFSKQKITGIEEVNLHKEPVFSPIVDFMNRTVKEYWQALEYDETYPIELSRLWACEFNQTDSAPLHVHGPSNVSVVFYIQKNSKEMGNLYFKNPNELVLQTQPLTNSRRWENRYYELDARTGDLVCFPSWIEHGILPNLTNTTRYVVAGDYELRGLQSIKK